MSEIKAKLFIKQGGMERGIFVHFEAGPFGSMNEAELYLEEFRQTFEAWKTVDLSQCFNSPQLKDPPRLAEDAEAAMRKGKK